MGRNACPVCHLYYKNIHYLQTIPNSGFYVSLHILKIDTCIQAYSIRKKLHTTSLMTSEDESGNREEQ
jgi:hypothetical protein